MCGIVAFSDAAHFLNHMLVYPVVGNLPSAEPFLSSPSLCQYSLLYDLCVRRPAAHQSRAPVSLKSEAARIRGRRLRICPTGRP